MKIFILEQIENVSDRFHSGGGLVVIAEDLSHAKQVIEVDQYISPTDEEWQKAEIFELGENAEPKFWVMPDAGCC